jgi:uncharacterized protein YukE
MSGQVHANPDDLKRLQKDVSKCVEEINTALKSLHRSLDRADWKDQARTSFEQKLKEATSNASRTGDKLNELQPILTKKISELQQYLRG